jgi:hypothetical protein
MIWSWYLSFPLSTISANDYVFNHISVMYWFSLPLLSGSMFLMALITKNNFLKWILSIGIVLTFFSVYYFYSMMPTGDSQYFRGLMEYFIKTKTLDSSQLNHNYYSWPAFFVLAEIVTLVSGVSIASYEFLIFTIIGVLLTTALYVYASTKDKSVGVITVAAFFISITYLIDYQAAPFSLALGLLFLMFMLETKQKSIDLKIAMIVLYASLLITHLFVPLFFLLYLLVRSLIDKNRQNVREYRNFFLLALVSYLLIQLTLAKFNFIFFAISLTKSFGSTAEYSGIATGVTSAVIPVQINVTAQFFSRNVTIAVVIICFIGLILLLIKRRINALDKAIFMAGAIYSGLGLVLNTLGYRAICIIFIPISLGASFFFKGKFKPYFATLFLILIMLFLFVPLHVSFNDAIVFQTRETYMADNFFIAHYDWKNPGFVVSDYRTNIYLDSKLTATVYFQSGLQSGDRADAILYTPQFQGLELGNYSSMTSLSQGEKLNVMYNDGSSYVLIKSS